jgi:hypothetical protein
VNKLWQLDKTAFHKDNRITSTRRRVYSFYFTFHESRYEDLENILSTRSFVDLILWHQVVVNIYFIVVAY